MGQSSGLPKFEATGCWTTISTHVVVLEVDGDFNFLALGRSLDALLPPEQVALAGGRGHEAEVRIRLELFEKDRAIVVGQLVGFYLEVVSSDAIAGHLGTRHSCKSTIALLVIKSFNEAASHVNTPLDGCTYPG